jgi:antitoxin HigA-1
MAIRTEDVAGMDFSDVASTERVGAVTPGDVLREEFMVPLGLSSRALARELGVPSNRITSILTGGRAVDNAASRKSSSYQFVRSFGATNARIAAPIRSAFFRVLPCRTPPEL